MKAKTLRKILRRFEILPLHHIDTDIVIEAGKDTELGNICIGYMNRLGYKYRGAISLSVLGEFLLIILRDTEKPEDKEFVLKAFDRTIKKQKISFAVPKAETYEIVSRIIRIDSRIESTDALHYALAVQEKANAFVTFDKKTVENRTLEKEFGVKIIHPKNL